MERETKKITTPVGKVEVELKAWLTGGEKMAMMNMPQPEMIDKMLESMIISPDIKEIKELHGKDFDFLLIELNEVAEESAFQAKKKE
jgi:hypothetical protein